MTEINTLLTALWEWLALHPRALPLVVFALPTILLVVAELVERYAKKAPEEIAPPPVSPEPTERALAVAEVGPSAASAEPAPGAEQLELPVSEPALGILPEPASVPEPEPAREAPPAPEPAPEPVRLGERLRRTREGLVGRIGALLGARVLDDDLLDELELLLFSSDLGVETADGLMDLVRRRGAGADADAVRALLREEILTRLRRVESDAGIDTVATPHVILVLGVNGSGKTTTIGKLAARYKAAGRSVILGAGDTFRAAAKEQLEVWGERVGCEVVVGPDSGDPSAVAYDTVNAARARKIDVAIIDTAGRLQTKKPLMEELGKMVRVIGKDLEGAPHETLLVLDSNTGQNAISQAEIFTEVAGVTGLVLTKLDGTAKGGVIVGLADKFGIPVKYVGIGESVEDLHHFSPEEFVAALFGESS